MNKSGCDEVAEPSVVHCTLWAEGGDAVGRCVVEPVLEVLTACQRVAAAGGEERLIVLAEVDPDPSPADVPVRDAGIAALRGLVHSLTLECGGRLVINLVIADTTAVDDVVALLASDDGDWIRGATFDLAEAL